MAMQLRLIKILLRCSSAFLLNCSLNKVSLTLISETPMFPEVNYSNRKEFLLAMILPHNACSLSEMHISATNRRTRLIKFKHLKSKSQKN
uniref:Secreted protein n=1 Tax=Octopus bimaculoides TaxID=37653 RepID=A0A0L8H1B6_OCTBM